PLSSTLFPYTTLFRSVLERLPQRGQAVAMRETIGHDSHDHAGDDADEADQGPQPDDREGALSERQGIHYAGQQDLLGDRHDPERSEEHTSELQSPYDL